MVNLKENNAPEREKLLDELFANAPEIDMPVELPSKGKFYKNFKGVKVSPLLFEDEQRILISRSSDVDPINEIISKCVHGVDVKDLLSMDKIYLLLKIKEVSYGPEYKFTVICPACKENSEITVNVAEHITVNYIPEDLEDPREFTLPVLKAKVKVRFPRNYELHLMDDWESTMSNTYRFVVSINDNTDPIFISQALKRMHIRDRKVIVSQISKSDLGVDPKFQFHCAACDHDTLMGVPFTASFFSVS